MINYKGYLVYDDGSIYGKRNKLLKPITKNTGYQQVTLYENGVGETWLLHILIGTLFIPNPDNKPCIGHKDCNRANNSVSNLYWCTYEENNNHPITLERKSKALKGKPSPNKGKHLTNSWKKKISDANSIPIIQYNDNGFEVEWEGINIAARELGYSAGNISACCRGERQTHKGYKWRFK